MGTYRAKPPVAAWIAQERRRQGWKAGDLAARLATIGVQVSEQTIRVWESNADRKPSPSNLDALERLFGSQAPERDAGQGDTAAIVAAIDAHDIAARVPGHRVVDIGAGTGALVRELRRRGKDAVGVDTSPGTDVLAGSVTALPLPDASMDAATLIEVVEHLDDATLDACIREAHRVLRPGGTLVITTPNAENLAQYSRECPECHAVFHIYQHVRRWTAKDLRAYLEERGFSTEVRGIRFVEAGPFWERILRRAWYRLRRQQPRLLATASR